MLLQTLGYIYLFKVVFSPDTWAVIELLNHITIFSDFPGSSDGKEFVCSVGDLGLIPWLGRASGEWNHYPYQISCLENFMDRGAWWATVYRVTKSQTCGEGSIRSNGVALVVIKRIWNALLGHNFKSDRTISACFQGKPFNITEIQINTPTTNAETDEVEWFYEDLQDVLGLAPKKKKK